MLIKFLLYNFACVVHFAYASVHTQFLAVVQCVLLAILGIKLLVDQVQTSLGALQRYLRCKFVFDLSFRQICFEFRTFLEQRMIFHNAFLHLDFL